MLSLFQRKRVPPTAGTPPTSAIETPKGLMRPESAASLLATPRRQKLLEHIWQRTSLSRRQFATLYLAPLERYAELVQQFPASENHHHAYPGGMLDHGLEIVAYALKLRQSYLLPAGVTPEAQAAQAEAWTAGTAYAALLHDIGKIAVDLHVEHADGSVWHPWHGPLRKPYRFRYRKEREDRLHSAATGLLYVRLLDRDIFDWLSGYPDLWAALLYSATVCTQRSTPSLDSGSHRRLSTISRISASTSVVRRVRRNTRRSPEKPSDFHNSVSAHTLPSERADSNDTVGAGGLAPIGSRPVIFSRPLITASSEPSTCSARPSVATVRFFTRPASSR